MGDDFLLRAAIEWWRVAATVRAQSGHDPARAAVLRLPRELAWGHLLFAAGHHAAAAARLRDLLRGVQAGDDPPATGVLSVDARAILARLRRDLQHRLPA